LLCLNIDEGICMSWKQMSRKDRFFFNHSQLLLFVASNWQTTVSCSSKVAEKIVGTPLNGLHMS
jgi:hypothetical protein